MITFTKKTEPKPAAAETSDNRFEQIRKAATERHKKSDTDGASARPPKTTGSFEPTRNPEARPR